jgi:two-component system, cell cycle sensor histidine kinase and response regulator CckA
MTYSRGRILLIDDDKMMAKATLRILSKYHNVEYAENGKAAYELLIKDETFDVILCDLTMPGMNGVELYETLKQRNSKTIDRFIFLTGGAFTAQTIKFLEQSEHTRIDKPFETKALLAAMESIISSRKTAA